KERADERVAGAAVQSGALKRRANQRWMRDGDEDAGKDRDAGIEEETWTEAVAEKQERAHRRDDRLNVQDHVHYCRVAVFQGQSEKDRADGRAGEAGEEQVYPSAHVDFANLGNARDEKWQ